MSAAVPIGRLRQRVRLEASVVTPTEGGAALASWMAVATLWAEVVPLSGDELVESDRRQGRVTHRVSLRYRGDVTTSHRLVLGTRILDIRSVMTPDGRRRHLICLCEETTR